jgi:hypothetical protein
MSLNPGWGTKDGDWYFKGDPAVTVPECLRCMVGGINAQLEDDEADDYETW